MATIGPKQIADDLMQRGENGEIDKIGIDEIRAAIPRERRSDQRFEELVIREIISRVG